MEIKKTQTSAAPKIMPKIAVGDLIIIGTKRANYKAQVFYVYTDRDRKYGPCGDIQVVYLKYQTKCIREDVVWDGEKWNFDTEGPTGVEVNVNNYPELKASY